MVINRSDAKKRKKEGEMLQNSLPESPKRTKVHAQRKFAQGSNLSSPTMTPVKDKDKSKSNGSVSSSELIPSKRPKTEDFLTFLCLRGTPILPARLDFFNLATVPDGQDDEQVQPVPDISKESMRSKTVPLHSNSKPSSNPIPTPKSSPKLTVKVTEKKTDACDLSSSGVNRRSEKSESKDSILRSGNSANKRSATAVQALKRKYQEQRLAKQRGNTLSKLVQIVKEKSMMRTRSSAISESIHLSTRGQPVVKLEKLSKSKIFKKIAEMPVTSPKKEIPAKKVVSKNTNSQKRITRGIVLLKESPPPATKTPNSPSKAAPKVDPKSPKRGSLRSHGSVPVVEDEAATKRRSISRQAQGEKQPIKPPNLSTKSPVRNFQDKKTHGSKPIPKGASKEFASSLSDFSSDDDQPLVRKSTKMSVQNVRRTKLVKKALKRIVMKNRKQSRMMTRSQQHRSAIATSRISHRPTRKTKEAAAVFMELIGKKWTSPEEDDGEDDLVALVNFPDIRRFNKQGKSEGENKTKTSGDSLKKEVVASKEKSKTSPKVDSSTKKSTEATEKVKEAPKDLKAKKNVKDKAEISKSNAGKEKKPVMSNKERILKEKMRRNAGKVICNKTAHSKCITSGVAGKKVVVLKAKSQVNQIQTRNRSLRSDSSDDVGKKQPTLEKIVAPDVPENNAKSNRTTRQSIKESGETKAIISPKVVIEIKDEAKNKSPDVGSSLTHPSRALRKSVTRNDSILQQRSSSQSEEKFSDSDEEPLGHKVTKSLRTLGGIGKSVQEKKEVSEKSKEDEKKTDIKVKEVVKKNEDKTKEHIKKKDDKSKDLSKKANDKSKEVNKGSDKPKDAVKKVNTKNVEGDDRNKEASKKGDSKSKETVNTKVVEGDDRNKEASKKGDSKSKETVTTKVVEADDRNKEASKKGDSKSKEIVTTKSVEADDRNKEASKKGDSKSKETIKKANEKSKESVKKGSDKRKGVAKKVEEKSREAGMRKHDEKSKESHKRASLSEKKTEEAVENEIHEISTRARSLKISASDIESTKVSKVVASDGEKSVKTELLKTDKEMPKDSEISHGAVRKRLETSSASDDVSRRVTRNENAPKSHEQVHKAEEKSHKKKNVSESGSVTSPKISTLIGSKNKEVTTGSSSKDHVSNLSTKHEGKRPLEPSDKDHGQSDSKKMKENNSADASKFSPGQTTRNEHSNHSDKTSTKSPTVEKFSAVGSKVDEALQSMKKDAGCTLISDTETPVELAKVDVNLRKKSGVAAHQSKKEAAKHPPPKKVAETPDTAAKCREPVEIRCDKMCEKSKLFSIEKQAHGGLVLVKKMTSSECAEDDSPSVDAQELQSQLPSPVEILLKCDVTASGSFTSVTVPNVPSTPQSSMHSCSCKSLVSVSGKSCAINCSPCPVHGEGTSSTEAVISQDQKVKDVDSPSKDSRKSSDDTANAESVHNTSVFGTDVDSFNDIECADNEVRRKVSKTVEEIEKWLLVSDIVNSSKIPEDKHVENELQANKIDFDNLRESMMSDSNITAIDCDDSYKNKKSALSSQVNMTLESVEKGIGIPLQTFYNRGMHKGLPKIPDPFAFRSHKVKEEKVSGLKSASHLGSKLTQTSDSVMLKGGKIPKNKVDVSASSERSKPEEEIGKVDPAKLNTSVDIVSSIGNKPSSSPPKVKTETKKSPSKSGGVVPGEKKPSSLRNFRMKHDLKTTKEESPNLRVKSPKIPSTAATSPGKVPQQSTKSPSNETSQASTLNTSSSSDDTAVSVLKSEVSKPQRPMSDHGILTSTPEKKPIILKGGNNFTVRRPKECVIRRTPSIGAFSPENESSVYAFETEDREATPVSTPFRRKTKDGGTNTSPDKPHHRHSSSSSESSSFVGSEVGSPSAKSFSSGIAHISKSGTPESSLSGGIEVDVIKNPTFTTSIAIQVNLDESLSRNTKSPPISVPIYIPTSSKEIGLSTSSPTPLVIVQETRSTECSTQTESSEGIEKVHGESVETSVSQKQSHATSEGHLFYIPLRPTPLVNQTAIIGSPTTSIASNQLIRGVAVKLGTEGPTGPNQRVIMHAELVTDPPQFAPNIHCQAGTLTTGTTAFSSELPEVKGAAYVAGTNRPTVQHLHPTVVSLPSDPKHVCHPSILPISVVSPASQPLITQQQSLLPRPSVPPPVGTVQPTTRPRPVTSVDGAAGKGPTLCVTSTQTDNDKLEPPWSGPNSVSEQPKPSKATPKTKETAEHSSPGPSSSKASTSKRSQSKSKGRASSANANEPEGSSSANSKSSSSVSLVNHPKPIATFPATGSSPRMVEAPTFHPTEKEFQDPLEFIERIRPIAEKYGLCRVVPPPNFKPDCQVSDDMRFTAYNQYVHKMLHRWGPNIKEMMAIKKYLRTQSISFTHPPWIGGMEVDLPRLYQTVQSFGGLKEVIEKKKWQRVADGMRIPKLAQDRVTKLDDIYCKYLLPYDTLSPDERQKLFDDIEKEWGDRENQPLNLEGQSNDDDSEGDTSDEFDECIVKGRSMALNAFYRIARNTMATWFKQPEPSATEVETEYWRHVTGRANHVCVHSGSIDSSVWGYGFPCTKGSPLARHPWNLKIFTNNSGSILRSMGPVMGVTVPTLHVGMLFTTCCWYRDPHGLPWVEYLHTGASKIWYGIPPSQSDAFRAAMTKLVPRYCKNKTIWLPSDTAMVPPNLLVKNGVSLCRTVQEPGQFILVFPRAFTSSICTGYLVSESVYFSQPGWLSTAEEVFKDIRDSCEPSMFSLERFLFRVATDTKSHVDVLKQVLPMIFRIRENELERRKQLSTLGLRSSERLPQQPVKRNRKGPRSAHDDDGDYECEICRANLYVSLVTDSNEECVYCLPHAIELLTKKKNHVKYCKLMYTYDQAELNDMIQKLLERIETKTQKKSQSKHGAVSR